MNLANRVAKVEQRQYRGVAIVFVLPGETKYEAMARYDTVGKDVGFVTEINEDGCWTHEFEFYKKHELT